MEIITLEKAKRIKFKDLSLALGTFDGLHIGHMAIIEAVKGYPGESAVFTFDSLPSDLLYTDRKPTYLFTLEEKKAAFRKTQIDYLCIASFDKKFATITKNSFETMLMAVFSPKNIVAGYNYTYGRHAEGNIDTLREFGRKHGINVDIIPPVEFDGEPVSSSRIRECIEAGSIERANDLLGYHYNISGTVEKGKGIGNKLGFPTANISIMKGKAVPRRGVYSVDAVVGKDIFKGVCNIGIRPTVSSDSKETIEVYIISLPKKIYGEKITIIFNRRIRDEIKFKTTEELKDQIKLDIKSI